MKTFKALAHTLYINTKKKKRKKKNRFRLSSRLTWRASRPLKWARFTTCASAPIRYPFHVSTIQIKLIPLSHIPLNLCKWTNPNCHNKQILASWNLFIESPVTFRTRKTVLYLLCFHSRPKFQNFENNTMKLSANEIKLNGLRARNCATIQRVLVLKICPRAQKVSGSFEKQAHGSLTAYQPIQIIVTTNKS